MIKTIIRTLIIVTAIISAVAIYTGHFQEWSSVMGQWIMPPLLAAGGMLGEWLASVVLPKP